MPAAPAAAAATRTRSAVAAMVQAATLAPSSHNTQPWLFRLDERGLELLADRTRALPVNDPDDRELTISCAAALFNARVAAAHADVGASVELFPDADDADLLARVTLAEAPDGPGEEGALFDALALRRTHRRPFAPGAVAPEHVAALTAAAAAEGASLRVLDPGGRQVLADLVAEGDRALFADARWRRELAAWMHPRRSGDGLVTPELIAPGVRFVVGHVDVGAGQAGRDRELAAASPVLAVLGTPGDGPADWMAAGQALERMLLTAARLGLQASFLNQPIQVTRLREEVSALCPRGAIAQIALRIGHPGQAAPPTPRRPLGEVLIDR